MTYDRPLQAFNTDFFFCLWFQEDFEVFNLTAPTTATIKSGMATADRLFSGATCPSCI